MGRGHRVFARFLRRNPLPYRVVLPLVLALACLVAVWTFTSDVKQQDESKRVSVETLRPPADFPQSFPLSVPTASNSNRESSYRPVYPYSIIPGGISSVTELKNAIAQDSLVKAHYRDFNLAKARIVRVTKAKAVYVSYRRGGGIYWTTKTVTLSKGETVLTDGENASRTRCGNRISERPTFPTSPEEPPPPAFDQPVNAAGPSLTPTSLAPTPSVFAPAPPLDESILLPSAPFLRRGGSSPSAGPEPPEPAPVPEPDTLYLLIVTLPVLWLIRKKRSS